MKKAQSSIVLLAALLIFPWSAPAAQGISRSERIREIADEFDVLTAGLERSGSIRADEAADLEGKVQWILRNLSTLAIPAAPARVSTRGSGFLSPIAKALRLTQDAINKTLEGQIQRAQEQADEPALESLAEMSDLMDEVANLTAEDLTGVGGERDGLFPIRMGRGAQAPDSAPCNVELFLMGAGGVIGPVAGVNGSPLIAPQELTSTNTSLVFVAVGTPLGGSFGWSLTGDQRTRTSVQGSEISVVSADDTVASLQTDDSLPGGTTVTDPSGGSMSKATPAVVQIVPGATITVAVFYSPAVGERICADLVTLSRRGPTVELSAPK